MLKKLLLFAFVIIAFASCHVSYSGGQRHKGSFHHHSREHGREFRR